MEMDWAFPSSMSRALQSVSIRSKPLKIEFNDSVVCGKFQGVGCLPYLKAVLREPLGAPWASSVSLLYQFSDGHSQLLRRVEDNAHNPALEALRAKHMGFRVTNANADYGSREILPLYSRSFYRSNCLQPRARARWGPK